MFALGGVLGAQEVSDAFGGRRLKVVQSVNGLYTSVYTRIISF